MVIIGVEAPRCAQIIMKILVTGSAGRLGEALVRVLRNTGHEVTGLDLLHSDFTNEVGAIADRDLFNRFMTVVDAVLHTTTLPMRHVYQHRRHSFVDTHSASP